MSKPTFYSLKLDPNDTGLVMDPQGQWVHRIQYQQLADAFAKLKLRCYEHNEWAAAHGGEPEVDLGDLL